MTANRQTLQISIDEYRRRDATISLEAIALHRFLQESGLD